MCVCVCVCEGEGGGEREREGEGDGKRGEKREGERGSGRGKERKGEEKNRGKEGGMDKVREGERKSKYDNVNKNIQGLDTLSLRCLLDIHLEILNRQLDRNKYKNLGITCVHKVHKHMVLGGIPRERGC